MTSYLSTFVLFILLLFSLFFMYIHIYNFEFARFCFFFILHLTIIFFCSRHVHRSGFPGPYNGHGTWNPRARHMYEELNGSSPRCRGHLPPCPGSDETMYTRCRGKKDDKRTINYICTAALLFNISSVGVLLTNKFRTVCEQL